MTETASDHARVWAWGDELIKAHDWFRDALATARRQFDQSHGGQPAPSDAGRAAPSLTRQLRAHCLTFCEGLHGHHTAEDSMVFPHLEQEHPELGAVLARLRQEHAVVAQLLDSLQAVLDGHRGAEQVRADFEQLASRLEAHLAYEEAQLVPALNALTGAVPWMEDPDPPSGAC